MPRLLNLEEYTQIKPWCLLSPYNCNLYPSVIKDNYNYQNKARIFIKNGLVVGNLFFNNGEAIWTFSSHKPVDKKLITDITKDVKRIDTGFKEFSVVSRNILPPSISEDFYVINDSHNEHEYVYKTMDTSLMKSKSYATPRRYVKKFAKLYGDNLEVAHYKDDSDSKINDELVELYESWLEHAKLSKKDLINETEAFNRYRHERFPQTYDKVLKLVYRYKGKVVGFTVNDIVSEKSAINLYFFGNLNLTGISHYMFNTTNAELLRNGISELNFQEDRGSEGLRNFKKILRPAFVNELVTLRIR